MYFPPKSNSAKASNMLVRFDQDVAEEIRQIAKDEGTKLVDVIRTFVNVGLHQYNAEKQMEREASK